MASQSSEASRSAGQVVLYQFAFSHFNEKVRWGLDWKSVPYEARSLLPGFHTIKTTKLTGRTETPVLQFDSETFSGSAQILEELERRVPTKPLFPTDSEARTAANRWVEWLDADVGPATRRGLFQEMLADPTYAKQIFTTGQPAWRGRAYGWIFPAMVPVLRKKMSIDADTARQSNELTAKALDRIATAVEDTGYLVGGAFTVADLTAASLLFPLSFPSELGFEMPEDRLGTLARWKARWAGHPAVDWMESIFRKHRRD